MRVGLNRFQAAGADMGIDLRRTNIGMAKQLLNDSQIGAVLQHMSRRGVPEGVRVHVLGDAGQATPLLTVAGYTIDYPEPKKNSRYSKRLHINASTTSPVVHRWR